MKFQFQSNLKYQLDSIKSVVDLFEGQQKLILATQSWLMGFALTYYHYQRKKILENRDLVTENNKITNPFKVDELDFCIQMETGTGKTYVYLRSIFDLHKKYGLNKFIIIVPSVAIRSGVLKTLEITKEHFQDLYTTQATVIEYDSKNIAKLKNGFCYNPKLSILVTTTSAFNSAENIINKERDNTNGEKLISLIAQTLPIIIMDEPQEGMDAKQTSKYINQFNPLAKLRYSATHKELKNLIYKLDSVEAYNQNLVKKIEVMSVFESGTESNLTLELQEIVTTSGYPEAKMELSVRQSDGTFKNKKLKIRDRDLLKQRTNNPVYDGWVVEKIMIDLFTKIGTIKFSNGKIFKVGDRLGVDTQAIFRSQIKYAIHTHFQKELSSGQWGSNQSAFFSSTK
ncbi:MAG: DEAD/DEAH box helicase family protein [Thermales bacterium]|nr:DEAD/DEAH box helicase family protein [Thermales bacterium]